MEPGTAERQPSCIPSLAFGRKLRRDRLNSRCPGRRVKRLETCGVPGRRLVGQPIYFRNRRNWPAIKRTYEHGRRHAKYRRIYGSDEPGGDLRTGREGVVINEIISNRKIFRNSFYAKIERTESKRRVLHETVIYSVVFVVVYEPTTSSAPLRYLGSAYDHIIDTSETFPNVLREGWKLARPYTENTPRRRRGFRAPEILKTSAEINA